jgi:predicted component of type VI protein secretion system
MSEHIHWHEGLFLQPHHLQALQRQLLSLVGSERRLRSPYPYGLVEARLSPDALENMLVQFDRLRAIMPSGLEVNIPENADLPALDIKGAFAAGKGGFGVSLGIPLWYASRANAVDQDGGATGGAPSGSIAPLSRNCSTRTPERTRSLCWCAASTRGSCSTPTTRLTWRSCR